ncbi:MAG: helix-turn-helix domain-containing protein [Terriglobia bacterium]
MKRLLPAPHRAISRTDPTSPRPDEPLMLSPQTALRILRRRTGGKISRPTFYRWLTSGALTSIRVGYHIYIPWFAMEDFIKRCLKGERV